jgi:hypothetical protein
VKNNAVLRAGLLSHCDSRRGNGVRRDGDRLRRYCEDPVLCISGTVSCKSGDARR